MEPSRGEGRSSVGTRTSGGGGGPGGGGANVSDAVIAAVLMAKKRLDSEGGQMKLCEMSDAVRETFQMLKLDGTIFDIRATKADAVDAF
mgnify:CR=1 FL=1